MDAKIARAVQQLHLKERTGLLEWSSGEVCRKVFFKLGSVVGARSSLNAERLGEIMLRHGRISLQHLKDASLFVRKGRLLGEVLKEFRIVQEDDEIERFVQIQLREIASSILIQRPHHVSFAQLPTVDAVTTCPLSVADIIMEAARRTRQIDAYLKALLKDDRPLYLAPNCAQLLERVNLSQEEAFILSRIDAEQPPRSVFSVSPFPEERTARTLLGLLQVGIVKFKRVRDPGPETAKVTLLVGSAPG